MDRLQIYWHDEHTVELCSLWMIYPLAAVMRQNLGALFGKVLESVSNAFVDL